MLDQPLELRKTNIFELEHWTQTQREVLDNLQGSEAAIKKNLLNIVDRLLLYVRGIDIDGFQIEEQEYVFYGVFDDFSCLTRNIADTYYNLTREIKAQTMRLHSQMSCLNGEGDNDTVVFFLLRQGNTSTLLHRWAFLVDEQNSPVNNPNNSRQWMQYLKSQLPQEIDKRYFAEDEIDTSDLVMTSSGV